MDVEKAERVEKLLADIRHCDKILDILNGELSSHYHGQRFALQYTSSTLPILTETLPAALEGEIINLINDYKKKLMNELENM